mgnify:CR=1 FL=1
MRRNPQVLQPSLHWGHQDKAGLNTVPLYQTLLHRHHPEYSPIFQIENVDVYEPDLKLGDLTQCEYCNKCFYTTKDLFAHFNICEEYNKWSTGEHKDDRLEGGHENVPTRDIAKTPKNKQTRKTLNLGKLPLRSLMAILRTG